MSLDIFVTVTHISDNHDLCYIHTISDNIETFRSVSYKEAMSAMRKLEKISGKFPKIEINPYDPQIWTKSLWAARRG